MGTKRNLNSMTYSLTSLTYQPRWNQASYTMDSDVSPYHLKSDTIAPINFDKIPAYPNPPEPEILLNTLQIGRRTEILVKKVEVKVA